ncbi:unnamed protein product, partial [Sphenostylis stenocarpa]
IYIAWPHGHGLAPAARLAAPAAREAAERMPADIDIKVERAIATPQWVMENARTFSWNPASIFLPSIILDNLIKRVIMMELKQQKQMVMRLE